MTFEEFKQSLKSEAPPLQLNELLQALWYAGKGDWEASHNIAQNIHSNDGSWIHAYLHRQEGDVSNASYWYRRAEKKMPSNAVSLEKEWEAIVIQLLD